MTSRKYFSSVIKSLLTLIALFGLLVGMLEYMSLSFTLDAARPFLVEQIRSYTGREVHIDGDVELSVSFSPELLVQRIHIRNKDDFSDEDFITISKVRIATSLLPLLTGEVILSDIEADQAVINLVQKNDGSHNWSLDNSETPSEPDETSTDANIKKSAINKFSFGVFQLTDVTINYRDDSRDQVFETLLDKLLIDVNDIMNPHAEITGSIQGSSYSLIFESDSLDILSSDKPWSLIGTGHIADRKTEIKASARIIDTYISGNVGISVDDVDLGRLLDTLGVISEQDAVTDNININAKFQGDDLADLYEQAEIRFQLGKGYWDLQAIETIQKQKLIFTSASTFTSWNKPVELHMEGTIAGKAVKLDFKTNRLLEFFDKTKKLDIDLESSIVDSYLSLKGNLDLPIRTNQYQLDIVAKIKNLEKINPIIHSDFPPFDDVNLSGKLIANERGFVLKSVNGSIGSSKFQSSIVIETITTKPHWVINLSSQQINLDDLLFDAWKSEPVDNAAKVKEQDVYDEDNALHSLRLLEKFVREPNSHFILNVDIAKVFSGNTLIGKARYQLHVRENAITLDNIDTEIPGGRITGSASIKTKTDRVTGHSTLNIDKFDYGIATRLFKPESKTDGIMSVNIDLHLDGSDITQVLDNATGQLDIVVWPKNTKSTKALNLWATNLYLILLPELKRKDSLVNCMIGLMNIENGVLKEELLAIDTTRLWIDGNIDVNFKLEQVKLSLYPHSKTARLFSLETPIRAQGSFSQIGLLLNPIDLTETYFTFITSPLHVPARWIFTDKPPEDGSKICEQLFDRDHVKQLHENIKRKEKQEIDDLLRSD